MRLHATLTIKPPNPPELHHHPIAHTIASPRQPSTPSRSLHSITSPHALFSQTAEASHTNIFFPSSGLDLYGNYSVNGPAEIRKIGDAVVAIIEDGGVVETNSGAGVCALTSQDMSVSLDSDASPLCCLVGQFLTLDGDFVIIGNCQQKVVNNKTVVSTSSIDEDTVILLGPGGRVVHPITMQPQAP